VVSLLYSLLAVFAVSFVSNATPFFGVSYTLVATSFLTQVGVTPLNFSLFVLVSSLGSSSSKNVMYLLGLGFGQASQQREQKRGTTQEVREVQLFST